MRLRAGCVKPGDALGDQLLSASIDGSRDEVARAFDANSGIALEGLGALIGAQQREVGELVDDDPRPRLLARLVERGRVEDVHDRLLAPSAASRRALSGERVVPVTA